MHPKDLRPGDIVRVKIISTDQTQIGKVLSLWQAESKKEHELPINVGFLVRADGIRTMRYYYADDFSRYEITKVPEDSVSPDAKFAYEILINGGTEDFNHLEEKMTDLKIGQRLWFVPSRHSNDRDCQEVNIEKIGRRWVYVSNGRFDLFEMGKGKAALDGGQYSSPGYVYLSRNLHDQEVEIRLIKRKLIADLQERNDLSLSQLQAIRGNLDEQS